MDRRAIVPFDTGKIKIGAFYQPQLRAYNDDPFMNMLQDALLKTHQQESLLRRLLRKVLL